MQYKKKDDLSITSISSIHSGEKILKEVGNGATRK